MPLANILHERRSNTQATVSSKSFIVFAFTAYLVAAVGGLAERPMTFAQPLPRGGGNGGGGGGRVGVPCGWKGLKSDCSGGEKDQGSCTEGCESVALWLEPLQPEEPVRGWDSDVVLAELPQQSVGAGLSAHTEDLTKERQFHQSKLWHKTVTKCIGLLFVIELKEEIFGCTYELLTGRLLPVTARVVISIKNKAGVFDLTVYSFHFTSHLRMTCQRISAVNLTSFTSIRCESPVLTLNVYSFTDYLCPQRRP